MGKGKYHIELKKASDLFSYKTTTSGIESDFEKGKISMFYHSYNPKKSFIAVPPELLKELAEKANDNGLVMEINKGLKNANKEKQLIIDNLRAQYRMRVSKKE